MITKLQEQVILGSMCGDASILKGSRHKNYHFSEAHCYVQKPYLLWKSRILKSFGLHYDDWCRVNSKGEEFKYCKFITNTHEYFTNMRGVFYPNGRRRKIITRSVLDRLDILGLAVWYLDDGHYIYGSKQINLSSCINELGIQKVFKEYFFDRWGLNTIIRSNMKEGKMVHVLHFDVKSSDKFLRMIKRYVPECLVYKLGHLDNSNSQRLVDERCRITSYQKIYRSTEHGKAKTLEYNKRYSNRIKKWYSDNKDHRNAYMRDYKKKWRLNRKLAGFDPS